MSRSHHFSPRLGWARTAFVLVVLTLAASGLSAEPPATRISGKVLDPQGAPVAAAHVSLLNAAGSTIRDATSDDEGSFTIDGVDSGSYQLVANAPSFVSVVVSVGVTGAQQQTFNLQFQQIASSVQAVTVVASAPSSLTPDPAQSILVHDQVLDANPGRPGAPISIPGLPIETASGGIKAPQYFAPGVAGDHGEPIAQYFQIGFSFPQQSSCQRTWQRLCRPQLPHRSDHRRRNASMAAPSTFARVTTPSMSPPPMFRASASSALFSSPATTAMPTDGGMESRKARHQRLDRDRGFLWQRTSRPAGAPPAIQAERASRDSTSASIELTVFGIGYYGFSYVPGLIPINVPVPGDTIDNRQLESPTTSSLSPATTGSSSEQRQFSFSGFFRNYALTLRSNFGDGLIQQSENSQCLRRRGDVYPERAPVAGSPGGRRSCAATLRTISISKHIDEQDISSPHQQQSELFRSLSLSSLSTGPSGKYFHYDLGLRQEEVWMDNQDLINPQNSFDKLATLTLAEGHVHHSSAGSLVPSYRCVQLWLRLSY